MGSLLGGSKKQTTTSTTTATLPSWLLGPQQDLIGRATSLMNKPYEAYTGERLEGFNTDQEQAFGLIRQLMGQTNPAFQQAAGINQQVANRGLQGFSQAELQQYMNPYVQNVLDISKRRQLEQFDVAKRNLASQKANIGAFGGSRTGLAEQQLYKNMATQLADNETMGLYNAYNDAQGRAMQGTQMAAGAGLNMANLATAQQSAGLRDAAALQQIGSQQQAFGQQGLDIAYEDWLNEQAYPYQQLQFGAGILNPVSQLMRGETNTTVQKQSGGSGLLGTALGIASMAMGIPGVGAAVGGGLSSMGLGSLAGMFGGNAAAGAFGMSTGGQSLFSGGLTNAINASKGFYGPGFKEGGLVGFADGGLVGKVDNFYNSLIDEEYDPSMDLANLNKDKVIKNQMQRDEMQALIDEVISRTDSVTKDVKSLASIKPSTKTGTKKITTEGGDSFGSYYTQLEKQHGLPKGLLKAVRQVESSGGKDLVSPKGALGPFQFMPATAKQYGLHDPFDEKAAAKAAAKYYGDLIEQFDGNIPKALAGYNWGQGNVQKLGMHKMPEETRNYIEKVTKLLSFEKGGVVGLNDGGLVTAQGRAARLGSLSSFADGGLVSYLKKNYGSDAQMRWVQKIMEDAKKPAGWRTKEFDETYPQEVSRPGDSVLERAGVALRNSNPLTTLARKANQGLDTVDATIEGLASPRYTQKEVMTPGNEKTIDTWDKLRAFNAAQDRVLAGYNKKNGEGKVNPVQEIVKEAVSKKVSPAASETSTRNASYDSTQTTYEQPKDMRTKRGEGVNMPLIAFGAALLGSKNDFFSALGEAGKAFVTTKQEQEAQDLALLKQQSDAAMDRLKTGLYAAQVQGQIQKLSDPYAKRLQELRVKKMEQQLEGGDIGKRTDNIFKTLMQSGMYTDAGQAMEEARRMVITEAVQNNLQNPQMGQNQVQFDPDDPSTWTDEQLMNPPQ